MVNIGDNISEAIRIASLSGNRVYKHDIAQKLWPDSKSNSQNVNMSKLLGGKTRKIDPEWITVICEETGVDANFLFNIKK